MAMLGYAFPLYLLGAVQVVLGLMLLGPIQTARPVIVLAKLSKAPVGKTVVATLATLLSLFLVPSLWELSDLAKHSSSNDRELGSLRQRCCRHIALSRTSDTEGEGQRTSCRSVQLMMNAMLKTLT